MQLRASNLNQIAACPASLKECDGRDLNIEGEPARRGSCGHEILRLIAEGKPVEIDRLALAHGLDTETVDELAERCEWIRGAIPEDAKLHWELELYAQLDTLDECVPGHADLILEFDSRADVYDWKFGYLEQPPAELNLQGMAYADGVFNAFDHIQTVEVVFFYDRHRKESRATFTRESGLMETIEAVVQPALSPNPPYRPGEACTYCAAFNDCPAVNREISAAITGLDIAEAFAALPMEQKAKAITNVRLLKKKLSEAEGIIKADAERSPIDMGGGEFYGPVPKTRETISTGAGWEVLAEECGHMLVDAVKVSKSAAIKAAQDYAAETQGLKRGDKTKIAKRLLAKLHDAGAINEESYEEFTIYKKGKD